MLRAGREATRKAGQRRIAPTDDAALPRRRYFMTGNTTLDPAHTFCVAFT